MSGGGGGRIIINRLAETQPPVSDDDKKILTEIADRTVVACSLFDAVRVIRIVWRLLRP